MTTKETTTKETYKGVCNFCHQEIDKAKMTQHLKSCKERKVSFEAQAVTAAQSQKPRMTKLYHILVEGTDLPMYWLHIELPALYTLYDLDDFLREIWVECCSHLSEFRVGKMSFLSRPDFMDFPDSMMVGDDADDDEEDEEEDVELDEEQFDEEEDEEEDDEEYYGEDEAQEELHEENASEISELMQMSPREMLDSINTMLTQEFQRDAAGMPLEEFENRFLQLFTQRLQAESPEEAEELARTPELQDQLKGMASALHTMFQFPMLANMVMPEEQDMSYDIRDVLKVGDKFSYEYDFGSTTSLRLKVIAEREGYFRKDEDPVRILARNLQPVIPCRECGQPATKVEPGYAAALYGALCDKCAKKVDEYADEEFLPVVNSPRTGVCGYAGSFAE